MEGCTISLPSTRPLSKRRKALDSFVGRSEILDNLRRWTTEFFKGKNQIVFIEGMGGIGKSLLVEKWMEDLSRLEHIFILARFDELPGDTIGKAEYIAEVLHRFGIKTPRFDIIRVLHRRIIDNTDPENIVNKSNPLLGFAKMIPVIGEVTEAASLLRDLGGKVKSYIESRRKGVNDWFESWFESPKYSEYLLRVIRTETAHENLLMLSALVSDIEQSDRRIILILDETEYLVNFSQEQKRRNQAIIFDDTELYLDDIWTLLLTSESILGIVSGRTIPDYSHLPHIDDITIQRVKLEGLNAKASKNLLTHYEVPKKYHDGIITASDGNPIVLILLGIAVKRHSIENETFLEIAQLHIEEARDESLAIMLRHLDTPLKTLVRLSSISPVLDEGLLSEITSGLPDLSSKSLFKRFESLNLIVNKELGWGIHESVRTLILSDLPKPFLEEWIPRFSRVLEKRYRETDAIQYLIALAHTQSLLSQERAYAVVAIAIASDMDKLRYSNALNLLESTLHLFRNPYHRIVTKHMYAIFLKYVHRLNDALTVLREAEVIILKIFEDAGLTFNTTGQYENEIEDGFSDIIEKNSQLIIEYLKVLRQLGTILCSQNLPTDAIHEYRKSIHIMMILRDMIRIDGNLYTQTSKGLAHALWMAGQKEKAAQYYLSLILDLRNMIEKAQYDSDKISSRKELAICLDRLGDLYIDKRQYENAREVLTEALDIMEDIASKDDIWDQYELSYIFMDLGRSLYRLERFDDAEANVREALAITTHLAAEHPHRFLNLKGKSLQLLANVLFSLGQYEESEKCYTEVLDIRRKLVATEPLVYEEGLVETLESYSKLLQKTNRTSEAEPLLREASKRTENSKDWLKYA